MDLPESTKVVYNRIQKLEPENVSKILGYILLQENAERDMIRLAFSPDNLLHSWINKAKSDLGLSTSQAVSAPISPQVNPAPASDLPFQFVPFVPTSSGAFSSPANFRATNLYFDPQLNVDQQAVGNVEFVPPSYADPVANLHGQLQFLSLEDQLDPVNSVASDFAGNYYYPEQPALGPRANRRTPSLPEFPVKVCHYFIKGFCKHGTNCRYFHGHPMTENFSQMFNASSNELANDDHPFSPGSLEKLELEITELLRSRRGCPVSIASLPMLYYEKYGRTLQAEGYLTESQRHGKAGYSLTKLLARLNSSIRLIDRPHGQHSVILAEDVRKYMDFNGERSDHGAMVAGSRQIYLTFPAESTFTEQDVSNYFNKYGPVQDVRIPCQQKRMFGFVTFVFAETVKQVLMKGNPHFVCGARVLVKPYREKSKLVDRKYVDKIPHPMFYASHFAGPECEVHSVARGFAASMPFSKQLMEEEQAFEAEGRHHSALQQMSPKAVNQEQYTVNLLNELKLSEDQEQTEFPSPEHFNYLLDVLNSGSTTDEKLRNVKTSYNDQDSSQGLNLPDSPFAPAVGTSISTVT